MSKRLAFLIFVLLNIACSLWAQEDIKDFLNPTPLEETTAFKKYSVSSRLALDEIYFLLDQIESSPYRFERKGKQCSGKMAAKHLRFKFRFAKAKVKTAEEFIEHVASATTKTKDPYYLIFGSSRRLPLKQVYYNELNRLRQYLPK